MTAGILAKVTPLQRYIAEEIATDHPDGLLSRREALRRLALLGVSATAASALIAACGEKHGEKHPAELVDHLVNYHIYTPTISTTLVVNAYNDPAGLKFVSCPSIAYYGGKFWAAMDGSITGFAEGSLDQQIWMTTSTDAATWSTAFQPFRNSTHCTNPVTSSAYEWQPNLMVVGTELWCMWSASPNCYISKLTSPTGKWTTYRFEFVGEQPYISSAITTITSGRSLSPDVDGVTDWSVYPSQQPLILSSGVVACPATIMSATTHSTQISSGSDFIKSVKYNAVLATSDGTTWSMAHVSNGAYGDYSAWEPYLVESQGGDVYLFSRNLDPAAAASDAQLVAHSSDGAKSFAPMKSTKMLVTQSRGYVERPSAGRHFMLHNDAPAGGARINGALFSSLRGVDDFVPGVMFSDFDNSCNYPQSTVANGALYVVWSSGTSLGIGTSAMRSSCRITAVSPLPSDDHAYIHPRSLSRTVANADPALVSSATPPYYDCTGYSRLASTGSVTPADGITYVAWIQHSCDPPSTAALIDTRATTTGGSMFRVNGASLGSVNVLHGQSLPPFVPIFTASVIDKTTMTVTAYIAYSNGSSFTTVTSYFKSVLFTGQPSDGDTITIDSVVYTFKSTPSGSHPVQIGAAATDTMINLKTAVNTVMGTGNNAAQLGTTTARLIISRTDGATFAVSTTSANITVETSVSLAGGQAYFGGPFPGSTVAGYHGRIYDAAIYTGALTSANLTSLYNGRRTDFGYSTAITGTSTAPSSPLLRVNPANPDPTTFPSIGLGHCCEVLDRSTLRIHGEGSAGIELPYGATQLSLRYKLGATPTSTDKYVIATFGTADNPVRLYVSAANRKSLFLNNTRIDAVHDHTDWSSVAVTVSSGKVSISGVECAFTGKPRAFLGTAWPESLLAPSKYVDFDVSSMTAGRA